VTWSKKIRIGDIDHLMSVYLSNCVFCPSVLILGLKTNLDTFSRSFETVCFRRCCTSVVTVITCSIPCVNVSVGMIVIQNAVNYFC